MEEVRQWFSVSLDAVKAVYHQLKLEVYIILVKKAGASIAVQLQEAELERNIRTFFSLHKTAMIDLCQALGPLFSHAKWYALKTSGPDRFDELERLCSQPGILMPYAIYYGSARPSNLRRPE